MIFFKSRNDFLQLEIKVRTSQKECTWVRNWDIEYWREYWGIEILDEKPRFHQQDQPSRSCSSAPQSSRSLKRLPPEQKLWKPYVKNTLKVFYSSVTAIKDFVSRQCWTFAARYRHMKAKNKPINICVALIKKMINRLTNSIRIPWLN